MTHISFIDPEEIAAPTGYTHVVSVDGPRKLLFISGQVSRNQKGETVGVGDLEAQTRQVYANLLAILKSQDASFSDVVKLNTYTTKPESVGIVRKVRSEFITSEHLPAATFVGVTRLADPALLIEIEAVAVL